MEVTPMASPRPETGPASPSLSGTQSGRRRPVPTPRNTLKKPVARERPGVLEKNGNESNRVSQAEEDILSALEKIPGVGNLRCGNNSGLNQSLPSLHLAKVRRDESSYSLGSHDTTSGQFSLQSTDMDSSSKNSTSNLSQKKSSPFGVIATSSTRPLRPRQNFFNTERPRPRRQSSADEASSIGATSISNSTKPNSPSKTSSSGLGEEDTDDCNVKSPKSTERGKIVTSSQDEEDISTSVLSCQGGTEERRRSRIQSRPLPDLPEMLVAEEIHVISSESEDQDSETKNVYSALLGSPTHAKNINTCQHESSFQKKINANGYLTLTGTIRKGRPRSEKSVECSYDIELSLSQEHLNKLEKKVHAKYHDRCFCGLQRGIHVFALTLLTFPFLWIYSTFWAFYLGTLTWYNIFIYFNEEKNCLWKLCSPFVLIVYPFWIVPVTFLLGLGASLLQISWYFDSWLHAIRTPDAGFFSWFCNYLNLPDCSPYQVILLTNAYADRPGTGATTV